MRHRRRVRALPLRLLALCPLAALHAACGANSVPVDPETGAAPIITGLAVTEISVGDPLTFLGSGFVDPSSGWNEVHFSGVFTPADGSATSDVDFSVALSRSHEGVLTWERFGGYRVPFTPAGDKLGTFVGVVWTTNRFFDDAEPPVLQQADWMNVSLTVGPSVVVLDNRVVGEDFIADCREPSTVMLQRMSYALRVKALGFEPARFEFVTTPGLLQADPTQDAWRVNTEPMQFGFDAETGNDEYAIMHRWAPSPAFTTGYQAGITAVARGAGTERQLFFPFIVRPWTYPAFEIPGQVAELLEPEATSGCIPGGPSSVEVSYAEGTPEEAARSLQSSILADVQSSFDEPFAETYDFGRSDVFQSTAKALVPLQDVTSVTSAARTTDLFSGESALSRRVTLAWESTTVDDTLALVKSDGAPPETFARYVDPSLSDLTASLTGFEMAIADGFPAGIANTFGIIYQRDPWSRSLSVLNPYDYETPYATTQAQNLAAGRTWGMPRTYAEQTGLPVSRSLASTQTFNEALATTTLVAETIGPNEENVINQSSTDAIPDRIDAWVWANQFGQWYRQTTRIAHQAKTIALDLCGNGSPVGDLTAHETSWGVDLAIGDTCPPPSNFPPAQCLVEPCRP